MGLVMLTDAQREELENVSKYNRDSHMWYDALWESFGLHERVQ